MWYALERSPVPYLSLPVNLDKPDLFQSVIDLARFHEIFAIFLTG